MSANSRPSPFTVADECRQITAQAFLPLVPSNAHPSGGSVRKGQGNKNGWHNYVPSTQSSKQSFFLYRRLVFGQARPANRLRYGQTASRASIQLLQLTPRALMLNKHRLSYLNLQTLNLDGLGLTPDTSE
ncbi:hypothetical protein AVEN_153189-1 [Araneus ventricosus]|uniref:Uncharacterized protein n=1 Tax=Araneus ventricosus TaxID=182803 RepID=A0A4Y2U4B2_ARAVE|nr:hypothetical protein AVEN_179688-1 [Araneus ventricosus]GBO06518.1 hypothetical protein AVEN_153189-1 [Araneus ventricosus]